MHVSIRRRPVVEAAVRANVEKSTKVLTDTLPS